LYKITSVLFLVKKHVFYAAIPRFTAWCRKWKKNTVGTDFSDWTKMFLLESDFSSIGWIFLSALQYSTCKTMWISSAIKFINVKKIKSFVYKILSFEEYFVIFYFNFLVRRKYLVDNSSRLNWNKYNWSIIAEGLKRRRYVQRICIIDISISITTAYCTLPGIPLLSVLWSDIAYCMILFVFYLKWILIWLIYWM
jgi:hypothetical protein